MTLLEEFNLRIDAAGGREVLARTIEKEWHNFMPHTYIRKFRNIGKENQRGIWTQEQIEILGANIDIIGTRATGKLIGKSELAVYAKAVRLGIRKPHDGGNYYVKPITRKAHY